MRLFTPLFQQSRPHRIIWPNPEFKTYWKTRIERIAFEASNAEILSVVSGQRDVTWQTVSEEDVFYFQDRLLRDHGLVSRGFKAVAAFSGFAHRHYPPAPGQRKFFCVVAARSDMEINAFLAAEAAGDNSEQGRLLGYPRCCSQFFSENWREGFIDPIWQAAVNSIRENGGTIWNRGGKTFVDLEDSILGAGLSNAMLRYIGIRGAFHIPHSFSCRETMEIAEERLGLMAPEAAADVRVLLRLPMEWSVRNGIALVKTPYFYIETESVPTSEYYRVRLEGRIPGGCPPGAVGITFPFQAGLRRE